MSLTLDEALDQTLHTRWRGMRSAPRNRNQAEKGIEGLREAYVRLALRSKRDDQQSIVRAMQRSLGLTLEQITPDIVRAAVGAWLNDGLEASTVVARLNCLSAIGVPVNGCRPTIKRKLKWWLTPEDERLLVAWLLANRDRNPAFDILADYIQFATRVGLRVEETLRLEWADIHDRPASEATEFRSAQPARMLITVPGLKTHMAQATLPISNEAAALLRKRRAVGATKPFNVTYTVLSRAWQEARAFLKPKDPRSATLRALRRSAARSLHVSKGMPLDIVRQYLRHEHVDTTLGYLRLTGGYGEEEIGKWL